MVTDLFELVTSKTVASWSPQRFFRHGHRENCFELVTENKFSSWSLRETFCELVTAEKRRIGRRDKVFEWVAAKVFELVAANKLSNWPPRPCCFCELVTENNSVRVCHRDIICTENGRAVSRRVKGNVFRWRHAQNQVDKRDSWCPHKYVSLQWKRWKGASLAKKVSVNDWSHGLWLCWWS